MVLQKPAENTMLLVCKQQGLKEDGNKKKTLGIFGTLNEEGGLG